MTRSAGRCPTGRRESSRSPRSRCRRTRRSRRRWTLLREGRPFSAHEVFEARWKDAPEEERDLWQGMAQLCVGLTHVARGNTVGASRLVERGAGRLEGYAERGGPTYGMDVLGFLAEARATVARH